MPTFNKGVFKDIQFEATPIGKLKISSIFRWYMPYAPGNYFNFDLSLKSLSNDGIGVRLFLRADGKEEQIGAYYCPPKSTIFKINGISIPGQGTIDYCVKPTFENDSVVVASVVATHNDWLIPFFMGIFITFILGIITWLITGFIHLIPFWEFWIPR